MNKSLSEFVGTLGLIPHYSVLSARNRTSALSTDALSQRAEHKAAFGCTAEIKLQMEVWSRGFSHVQGTLKLKVRSCLDDV